MMAARISYNSSFVSAVADIVGAYTLTRVIEPAVVLTGRVKSSCKRRSIGLIVFSRLLLTAKRIPYYLLQIPFPGCIMCNVSHPVALNPPNRVC